nr:hypothetical protein [Tanacetum cinerariifolium]
MNPVATQQVALNNALVALEKRLKIEKCNARIEFSMPQREDTYQVTLDALKLSPCYPAFLITAEVLEIYMYQFWNTIKKIKDTDAYRFKLDKKNFYIYIKVFCEILRIYSKVPNQDFVEPSSKDEMVSFIKDLRDINKSSQKLLGILKFVSKTEDCQKYGALILKEMINQDIKDSKAYKTYLGFATGEFAPKKARKFKKIASPSKKQSPVLEEEPVKKPKRAKKPAKKSTTMPTTCVVIRDIPDVFVSKKKVPVKVDRGKGIDQLFDVALLEATRLKKALKKNKQEAHKLHASGSGNGVGSQLKVPDESRDKTTCINKGTSTKLGVLDVPKDQYESENESWGNTKDVDSNDDDNDDDDVDGNADGDNKASDSERLILMKKYMKKSTLVLLKTMNSLMMMKSMRNCIRM